MVISGGCGLRRTLILLALHRLSVVRVDDAIMRRNIEMIIV